jgi:hypothetical protein
MGVELWILDSTALVFLLLGREETGPVARSVGHGGPKLTGLECGLEGSK